MIVTFPYYDPTGKYNDALRRQLRTLKSAFNCVCLSVVPPTAKDNAHFVRYLEEQGCLMVHNAANTSYGIHSREALRLASKQGGAGQNIFFGFLDRILFALENEWCQPFLGDLKRFGKYEFMVFERSESAWQTQPANFREIEQMVSRMFVLMHGQCIDLMPCAFIFSQSAAGVILSQSISASTEVWAEWVLLAIKNRIPMTKQAVDWLAWKDAYWERVDPEKLKRARESSRDETVKRIKMNVPAMLLLTEERFRDLQVPNA